MPLKSSRIIGYNADLTIFLDFSRRAVSLNGSLRGDGRYSLLNALNAQTNLESWHGHRADDLICLKTVASGTGLHCSMYWKFKEDCLAMLVGSTACA
jgi:hypothetical protein